MKITAVETLRVAEFANVLWVRVHSDAGVVGLGETFYGAEAVEAHIHETLAQRLLGRDPLRIEAAITLALDAALPALVREITERVLVALGH